jgi:monoamine oxidase
MPYLVSNPYPTTVTQPTEFKVVIDGGTAVTSAAQKQADNSVRLYHSVSAIASGPHTAVVTAVAVDAVWGRLESAASDPFVFTKPSAPGKATGLSLIV